MANNNNSECMFFWWEDCIGLELPGKYLLMYWRDGRAKCGLCLREQMQEHGEPGKTYIDGLDTRRMTMRFKQLIESSTDDVYHRNIVYDVICEGDCWFTGEPCNKFGHLKRLIQRYKFRKESHVYVWPNHISLELSNRKYCRFRPNLISNNTFKDDVPIAPQATSFSLEEDEVILGAHTRKISVGFLNEHKVMEETERLQKSGEPYRSDKMNGRTFVVNALCYGSNWYNNKCSIYSVASVDEILLLANKRNECKLYRWSRKRIHLSLQLPNGEYISHYPDGSKKSVIKSAIRKLHAKRYISYKHEACLKKPPDQVLTMSHIYFDVEKMTNCWDKFQDSKPDWDLGKNSCCSVVYKILCEGSELFRDKIQGMVTPSNVMKLAIALEEENTHSDESFKRSECWLLCFLGIYFLVLFNSYSTISLIR